MRGLLAVRDIGGRGFNLSLRGLLSGLTPPQQLGQTRTRQAHSHLNKPLVTTQLSTRGHQKWQVIAVSVLKINPDDKC